MINPETSLGDLVAAHPAHAGLFERLRLDYCCGGGQSLAEACRRDGLDPQTVARMLDALGDSPTDQRRRERHDWRRASIAELCDHIVAAHHERLRVELPRVGELLATVVRVHGAGHPELHDLQRLFASIRQELEEHLDSEERALFPACQAAEADGSPVDDALLSAHEHDHADTGDALAALRELASDYDTGTALCGTHRRLLQGLAELELDLHQHIHEENNILFPRVRAVR